ncbi:MAG TPA: hypothetical protein GXX58_06355 [Gelria sp.]|jgi:hypothetical protein|nr:hypothetical protein [Gelria sp.]
MVEVIVKVKDKTKVHDLAKLGTITHVSKYLNIVLMEVSPPVIPKLELNPNVIDIKKGRQGQYQL